MLERTKKPQRIAELEAELALPPFPEALAYLWTAYNRIRRRKGMGFSGPLPIELSDIDAFSRMCVRLEPWEVELIELLDDVYLAAKETDTDDHGQ